VIEYLNSNSGAVTGLATIAMLLVTAFYAWTTYQLLSEAKQSRLLANQPRVVAYLRSNEVHNEIVQLCVANLSGSAAIGVSAHITKVTEWPDEFLLQDSTILRDLNFMRPHEVLKFDLGMGRDLLKGDDCAVFQATISYTSLDKRSFQFKDNLRVESVHGFNRFTIYTVDDVARRLKEISETLKGFAGFNRLKVETYDTVDREVERDAREQRLAAEE
jgi:hypothetical protein